MAKQNIPKLSEGFEEVPLSEGFEEVPLSQEITSEKSTLESVGETASDLARGVGSGLTFGGVEELLAGGKALLSDEKESLQDLYRKYLEVEEKKTKEAQERSPVASTVGEVIGALAPALVTGGASMAATGGSTIGRLAGKELAKAAGKAALVEGGFGAAGGALAGGLTSEEGKLIGSTPEEREKLLEDIGSGALTGGVLGGAVGGAAPYAKKLVQWGKDTLGSGLEKTQLGQEIKTAAEMGKVGKGFVTLESKQARLAEKDARVSDIRKFLTAPESQGVSLESAAAKEFKEPLEALSEVGLKVKLPEKTFKSIEFIEKQVDPSLATDLYQMALNGVSPNEAYALRTKLKKIAQNNPTLADSLKSLWKNIDDSIEDVVTSDKGFSILDRLDLPISYKSGLATYSNVLEATIESITEQGKPTDARRRFFHELAHEDATLNEKIQKLVEKFSSPGTASEEARRTLEGIEGGVGPLLDKLAKSKPEEMQRIARRMGFESADELKETLLGKIKKASREATVSRVVEGERPFTEGLRIGDILSRKPLLQTVNIGSQVAGSIGRGAKTLAEKAPAKVSKQIYSLPETALRNIASKLEQSPTMNKYARKLTDALNSGDTVKKDAVLFLLMQNPDARALIPELIGEEE